MSSNQTMSLHARCGPTPATHVKRCKNGMRIVILEYETIKPNAVCAICANTRHYEFNVPFRDYQ